MRNDSERRSNARSDESRESGVALLLVIMVLTALVIIGTPFVISMKLHEKGSRHTAAQERARLAQLSARNHAVAELFNSHPSREEGDIAVDMDVEGIDASLSQNLQELTVPARKVDDLEELSLRLGRSLPLTALGGGELEVVEGEAMAPLNYELQEVTERVLDVEVEDEQGKINLNTALPTLLGNLIAGSHLSEAIDYTAEVVEIPLEDTTPFPADDDPDTVDGVVIIFNPILFLMEAVSYRGKTDTHLTGCFRGEYLSGTWPADEGFPVFDLRGMKVFLHRIHQLGEGELRTYRTPQSIREIADWSVVPYFAKTLALVGLNVRNMEDFGLTPQMLARAGLGELLDNLVRDYEKEADLEGYKEARKKLRDLNIPEEALDLIEAARGRAAVVTIAEYAERYKLDKGRGLAISAAFETEVKKQLKKFQKHTKAYFPRAIEAFKETYDQAGLETFRARDFELIRDSITTTSTLPAAWSEEQLVIGHIENNPLLGVPSLPVARFDWFNPGTIVRVRSKSDPTKVEYGLVGAIVGRRAGGAIRAGGPFGRGVILREPLKYDYDDNDALITAMLRHPVNINTASRKVLEACVTGVRMITSVMSGRKHRVTSTEARVFADYLIENMPIVGFEHYRNLVTQAAQAEIIDDEDIRPLLINALNPNHPMLGVSTTGFCYSSGDVYTIESSGIVNSRSGLELASKRVREIIEVAPPDVLEYVIDSQDDWAYHSFIRPTLDPTRWGDTSRTTMLPGREGNLMVTGPNVLSRGNQVVGTHMQEGALRAQTARLDVNNRQRGGLPPITFGEVEHFDDTIEGQQLLGGQAHTVSTEVQAQANPNDPNPPPTENICRRPGSVEFWVRPNWGSRGVDRTFFDMVGEPSNPDRNRILLYYDGNAQELVFRVSDNTEMDPGMRRLGLVSAAEVRHRVTPTTFADDTWYHIAASWGSTAPGDQLLMIDNRPVGLDSWRSSLAQAFAGNSMKLSVADADFADRMPSMGVLRVGSEVVEYSEKQGTTFTIREADRYNKFPRGRGVRGSSRIDHPQGTPVQIFGYSTHVLTSDARHRSIYPENFSTNGWSLQRLARLAEVKNTILVGTGGAKIDGVIGPAQRIVYNLLGMPVSTARYRFPRVNATEYVQPGQRQIEFLLPTNITPVELGFSREEGYLQLLHITGTGNFVVEYVKYVGVQSVQPVSTAVLWRFTNVIRGRLDTVQPPGSTSPRARTLVFGASIRTDGDVKLSEAYPRSGVIQIRNDPRLTQNDPALPVPPEVEWVYYSHLADERFFVADWREGATFRGFVGDTNLGETDPDLMATGFAFDENSMGFHLDEYAVFPVIRVDAPVVGRGDVVYITGDQGNGDVDTEPGIFDFSPNEVHIARTVGSGTYVSFIKPFENTYRVPNNPRLKMFPSGELPVRATNTMAFGAPAVPGLGPGGGLDATIDEIRLSRPRHTDVDFTLLPHDGSSRFKLDPAPEPLPSGVAGSTPDVDRRVLRWHFRGVDGVDAGEPFDRLKVIGRGRLKVKPPAPDGTLWRYREGRDPRSFGLGKEHGLMVAGGEVYHYRYDLNQAVPSAEILLRQDLPADLVKVFGVIDPDGNWPIFNPTRDLTTEVWRSVDIQVVKGKLPANGGFIEIFSGGVNEILFYESATSSQLRNVLRGQLGTQVGSHVVNLEIFSAGGRVIEAQEVRGRLVPMRDLEVLKRGMLATLAPTVTNLASDPVLPITQLAVTQAVGTITEEVIAVESTADFPSRLGYLLRDDGVGSNLYEIIGYTRKQGSDEGHFFARALDDSTRVGLFRGRFGTANEADLGAGITLVEFPVRYHDRYQPEVESSDLMYYQRSVQIPGARWSAVRWMEEEYRNRTFANEVRVLVRFDGAPEWDEKPTNRPGGLYLFTRGDDVNAVDIEADLVEFRVYFRYPQGSYGPNASSLGGHWNDSWKHTPVLDSLSIQYRKPWRVIHREDLPY